MRLPGAIAAALALAAVSGSAVAAGLRQDAPRPSTPPGPTCDRPYSASSPWNAEIPADAAVDPASAAKVATMDPDNAKLTSDPTQFTFPVYYADASTPRVPVTHVDGWFSDVTDSFSEVFATGTSLLNVRQPDPAQRVTTMPLPLGATPAAGYDRQVIVIDETTGDEWNASYVTARRDRLSRLERRPLQHRLQRRPPA